MEFFALNGARVSRIGLGTWAIGGSEWGEVSDREATDTCLAIFDHGVLVDTAPIYGHGRAEELIGKATRQRVNEKFYIATKAGLEWNDRGVFATRRQSGYGANLRTRCDGSALII